MGRRQGGKARQCLECRKGEMRVESRPRLSSESTSAFIMDADTSSVHWSWYASDSDMDKENTGGTRVSDGDERVASLAAEGRMQQQTDDSWCQPQPLRTFSALSAITNDADASEMMDAGAPSPALSATTPCRDHGEAAVGETAAKGGAALSDTVGDWAATLQYCLEDGERGERYGACIQVGVLALIADIITPTECRVEARLVEALAGQLAVEGCPQLEDAVRWPG
jgi:hypothetical protein